VRALPWAAGALAFAVYAWFAAPGPYWLDSQELGSAAVRLGVPHPTGFPLFCLVGRALAWLPLGELAFRVHLGSALAAAIAVGVVARLAAMLGGADRTAAIGGAAAALVLGGSFTFFRQATVTEVYASTAAAIAIAIVGLWRVAGGAGGLGLALFAGVAALGLHSSFALLLLPAFAAIYGLRIARGSRRAALAPAMAVLGGAAILAYLPLRSASGHVDAVDWGQPRDAAALVDHVSGGRIRRAFEGQMLAGGMLGAVLERVEDDAGALALVAACGGALALALRRGRRVPLLLALLIIAGDLVYAVLLNPMGVEQRQTGTPLLVAVALLAGAGVAAGARVAGRFAPIAAAALAALISVAPLASHATDRGAARASDAARAWGEAVLAATPPRGVALLRDDSTISLLFWLTLAEPVRPDVAALARQHLPLVERTRAVLGRPATLREILAGERPVVWEIADDPASGIVPGVPVGRRSGAPVIADVERIFRGSAAGDGLARPLIARAFHNAGVLRANSGDLRRGVELVERSLAIAPVPGALLNAARFRFALGEDARALAEAATRAQPARAAAWSLLGTIDARAGRCADARRHLDRALELDPEDRDARANRPKLGACVER
jgi:tetratricopeptide (TPR) repeat protein